MPIYEYQCTDCHNVFERWCKCSELEEFISCPLCSAQAKHIISNTAFVLKGSGWYVTEYGNKKNVSDQGEAPKTDAKADAKENTTDKSSDEKLSSNKNKTSDPKPKLAEATSPSTNAHTSTDT